MVIRDSLRASAAPYLLSLNRYRIVVATPTRILVLDTGKTSLKTVRGVVLELPRSTRLGPPAGLWYKIPAGQETLRVHRRYFKDIESADATAPDVDDAVADVR